jgi:Domain of unknown function (DUF4124)
MRLLLILTLLLLPLIGRAWTDDAAPIHRCVDASGQSVFTDRMCADVQATPALPAAASTTAPATITTPGGPPPILCANNLDALKQAVVDAFAAHDPNRITGLMLWNGYGKGSVVGTTRMLSALMDRTLLDLDTASGRPSSDDTDSSSTLSENPGTSGTAPPPPAPVDDVKLLVIHTSGSDGSGAAHETRLVISRRSGCMWLLPPS